MVGKFWEGVAGELAKKWAALAATMAAAFWAAGALAWAAGHKDGWSRLDEYLSGLDASTQLLLAAGAAALILGSAYLASLVTPPILRLLQGDLPADGRIATWKRGRVPKRREKYRAKLSELQAADLATLSPAKSRQAARLDKKLHDLPVRTPDARLSALGNRMAASEARPILRFGLHPGVAWPALWLVLPELTREELQAARRGLDSAVVAMTWGLLLLVWVIWTPWAILAAVLVTVTSYATVWRRADAFGELSEATFALYRFSLYAALGFPRPKTAQADTIVGAQVTEYLWRGVTPPGMKFAAATPAART